MLAIYCLLFSLLTSITIFLDTSGFVHGTDSQYSKRGENTTLYYGCQEYSGVFHCDRLHNKFTSYRVGSNSSTLYHVTDTPTFVTGKEGNAIQMYANHLKSITFSNTSKILAKQFSIAFWIRGTNLLDNTHSPQTGHALSQFNDRVTSGWSFNTENMQDLTKESITFVVFNEKGQPFSSPKIPIYHNNSFTHIVGTFDGSLIRVYKDGKLFGENKFNGTYNYQINTPLTLGVSSGDPMELYWTGNMDDLIYYNKAISIDEVKQIYNNEYPTNLTSKDLVGHWKFDGDLKDISGNNYHGSERTLISSMVFAPDGRLFFSEKDTGNIKIMKDGNVNFEPFARLYDYYSNWEQGLLGLAIDPNFKENHFIYLFYTSVDKNTGNPFNRIVRFTDVNSQGKNETVILDNLPASKGYHSGGAMSFGVDDKLYVTIGDATRHIRCGNLPNSTGAKCAAQDPSSLLGKVLRINKDGSIPNDNPYPNSPIYNTGHLNMYGIAFDKSGFGLVSENGDWLYDEINTIEKGANYGSPTIQPFNIDPELSSNSIKPLRTYYIPNCLTQMIYYDGNKIPPLKGEFLAGALSRSSSILALQIDTSNKQVVEEHAISLNNFPNNQIVALAKSPDGDIYYASYDINRLDSVNFNGKSQSLFPIQIDYSSSISELNGLIFIPSNNELRVDLKNDAHRNDTVDTNDNNSKILNAHLTIKIPNKLLDEIISVKAKIDGLNRTQSEIMEFGIHKLLNSNDTVLNISLKDTGQYQLSIIGRPQ